MKLTSCHLICSKVSFVSSRLIHVGHWVWSPKGDRAIILSSASLSSSFSLTALLSLSEDQPIVLDLREETNTQVRFLKLLMMIDQYDFLCFVFYLVLEGHLCDGDFFFLDSAWVHGGDATWELIFGLLASKNIQLIWLPKYSPEFNPVELFWRFLKENLRHLPEASTFGNLEEKVVEITASVPLDYVFGWYLEAITKWNNPKIN